MNSQVRTLKDALYNTVHRNELSVAAIAEEIGMGESYLYRTCLPETEDGGSSSGVRFPLKKLIPLVKATGDHQTLDFIERSLGRVAVNIPMNTKISSKLLAGQALAAAADFGGLMQAIQAATAAGSSITSEDRADVIKIGWAAIRAIVTLTTACEQSDQ